MYDIIGFYTFIALLLFFVFAEIYRSRHYLEGVVIGYSPSKLIVDALISSQMDVQLKDGTVVKAEASQCTMCMGKIVVGEKVYLTKIKEKYIVNLPIKFSKSIHRISCKEC